MEQAKYMYTFGLFVKGSCIATLQLADNTQKAAKRRAEAMAGSVLVVPQSEERIKSVATV